ncbi:MAG: hypothetical protein LBC74_05260 [Planctomycetaceae bacterium]|jgi:hypothetical protein|nr:hypothetical protein [Planctomycetaceae bacterium]
MIKKIRIGESVLLKLAAIIFGVLFLRQQVWAEELAEPSPELLAKVARLRAKNIPLIDYHIHIRGGMTAEKAIDWERKTGIKSGVLENTGEGWSLSDNNKLEAFIKDVKKFPVLVGIQVNDRNWYKTTDKKLLESIDYVLADTMIMSLKEGAKPQKLWLEVEYEIEDHKKWLERYWEHCLIVVKEPIDILANPTYLPPRMEEYYDEFWNDSRMGQFIDAAVKNNVALEIQTTSKFPKARFIALARQKGAKFTIGRNNFDDKKSELKRSLDLLEKLDIKPDEMFVLPAPNKKLRNR